MRVDGVPYRTIWRDGPAVAVIDQRALPHDFRIVRLAGLAAAARAISEMWVRGAPLIGATAAHGMALAMAEDSSDAGLDAAAARLAATRPTAVNLAWAIGEMWAAPCRSGFSRDHRVGKAFDTDQRGNSGSRQSFIGVDPL